MSLVAWLGVGGVVLALLTSGEMLPNGNALLEIRDNRLYRQTHGTFEEYCRDRWEFSGEYARLTMRAAEVIANLEQTPTIVGVLPATESQARPLTTLQPEAQREVWQVAVETAPNGKVTAAHVPGAAHFRQLHRTG